MKSKLQPRVHLIQYFIDKYKFNSYLEVGVKNRVTFDKINCREKVGIDPILAGDSNPTEGIALYAKDSDTFFKTNKRKFDIVFIDGLHLYEQTMRDTINSWNCLNLNGVIMIHDCLPTNCVISSRVRVTSEWTGDVWKSIVWFRESYPKIDCSVVNVDYGCGVIIKSNDEILTVPKRQKKYLKLNFNWLQLNLNLLNIKTFEQVQMTSV